MSEIDEIVEFVKPYYPDLTEDYIRFIISRHIYFNTIVCPKDENGEFYGVAIFNIKGFTAFISQVVVNPKYRREKVLKLLIALGWAKWKTMKYIAFERQLKKNDRGLRIYKLTNLFKGEQNGWK